NGHPPVGDADRDQPSALQNPRADRGAVAAHAAAPGGGNLLMEAGVRTKEETRAPSGGAVEEQRRSSLGAIRTTIADYLTLTKPKVQSLLLFTTVTTMFVAGTPSVSLVVL